MEGFRFQEPLWLWAGLLGPLLLLLAWRRERHGPALLFPGVGRARPRPTWRVRLRFLPVLLAALGISLAAVALARPQLGSVRQNVTTQGVDIVVALDVSGSMAAEDFQPKNRLNVAKEVVAEFVKRRTHDRIGLVVFAAKSLTKSPPTTDSAILLRQLDDVKLGMLPDGTAIGSGLATSLTRLRHSKARSRVIVLVTDGVNNTGEIDPKTAADLARAMEVRTYTVGVGHEGPVPIRVKERDPFTGQVEERVVQTEVKIDEDLLKQIAQETGGEYFRADAPETLRRIFDEIDHLEKSEIQLHAYHRYRELFHPWLVAAAGLLLAGGLLWVGGQRVTPA
jgi:Ca-activated chloride channel family protein